MAMLLLIHIALMHGDYKSIVEYEADPQGVWPGSLETACGPLAFLTFT